MKIVVLILICLMAISIFSTFTLTAQGPEALGDPIESPRPNGDPIESPRPNSQKLNFIPNGK